MFPTGSSRGPDGDEWVAACEACLRSAQHRALAALLPAHPPPERLAETLFYRGRIAAGEANFLAAAELFRRSALQAAACGQAVPQQRSLVWEAYCHVNLGNYPLAKRLAKRAESEAAPADVRHADIYFVHGLIATERGTMKQAANWLTKARAVAQQFGDDWMEARCCANLAAVYSSLGRSSQAVQMIRRVEKINTLPDRVPNPQQLLQVRNIHAHVLRFQGATEEALRIAEPVPDTIVDGSRMFQIYLMLTAAVLHTEQGTFARAEALLDRAATLVRTVSDDDRTLAEVYWERAWLAFRRGDLTRAGQDIDEALRLVHNEMDTECFHAYAISAIINMHAGNLGMAGVLLNQANDRFRRVGSVCALAGTLLHYAAFLLRHENLHAGREALAEALKIMRDRQLYGTAYWDPPLVAHLCRLAMQEDVWGGQAPALTANLFGMPEAAAAERFALEGGPDGMWAEYATSLAVRRLAAAYWREFVPLLADPRARVRERAGRVLNASGDAAAQALLSTLPAEPAGDGGAGETAAPAPERPIRLYSFGRTRLLIGGRPLKLAKASTSKALLILAALLLNQPYGVSSRDLGLLLWPDKDGQARSNVLQMTVSNLRMALGAALDPADRKDVVRAERGRYFLRLPDTALWWDWQELRRLAAAGPARDAPARSEAEALYREPFMPILAGLLPPPGLDPATESQWERVACSLRDLATDLECQATDWIAAIRADVAVPRTP